MIFPSYIGENLLSVRSDEESMETKMDRVDALLETGYGEHTSMDTVRWMLYKKQAMVKTYVWTMYVERSTRNRLRG